MYIYIYIHIYNVWWGMLKAQVANQHGNSGEE